MAKKSLSSKVEHCPACGILKSKNKQCKHCGYGAASQTAEQSPCEISLKLTGYDMNTYDCVIINGVKFYK